MKITATFASLSLAVAAVCAADSSASAAAVTCDLTVLAPLLQDTDLTTCASESGLAFPPTSAPSADLLASLCAVPECVSLIAKVKATNLGDCLLGTIKLETDLITPAEAACGNSSSTTGSMTDEPITMPTETTEAPIVDESSLASATGSAEEDETDAPTSTVPTPSTTESGAAVVSLTVAGCATLAASTAVMA
nr:elicitin-like protein [Pythium porphyrae]